MATHTVIEGLPEAISGALRDCNKIGYQDISEELEEELETLISAHRKDASPPGQDQDVTHLKNTTDTTAADHNDHLMRLMNLQKASENVVVPSTLDDYRR